MRCLVSLVLFATLLAFPQPGTARGNIVNAGDYSSFWIWGGVKPQPVLAQAECIYILQGQVVESRRGNKSRLKVIAQGMPVARIRKGRVWLVYRADTLSWTPEIVQAIISRLNQWRLSGNPVAGLQVDFDVRTRHLHEYAVFLRQLRARLPADYRLGITGLLDWSCNGDMEAINELKNVVDEVTVQTYQGRKTIVDYRRYLHALKRLTLPFRIGLIQNGLWQAPEGLEANPLFRGYVVFLRNMEGNRNLASN